MSTEHLKDLFAMSWEDALKGAIERGYEIETANKYTIHMIDKDSPALALRILYNPALRTPLKGEVLEDGVTTFTLTCEKLSDTSAKGYYRIYLKDEEGQHIVGLYEEQLVAQIVFKKLRAKEIGTLIEFPILLHVTSQYPTKLILECITVRPNGSISSVKTIQEAFV